MKQQVDKRKELLKYIDTLSEKQRAVLTLRYNADGSEKFSVKDAGRILHFTPKQISFHEQKAFGALSFAEKAATARMKRQQEPEKSESTLVN